MKIMNDEDFERFVETMGQLSDTELKDQLAKYDKLVDEALVYDNWYATDLYVGVCNAIKGELFDRQEKALAKERRERRKHASKFTLGERIGEDTRQKLLALKQQLASC